MGEYSWIAEIAVAAMLAILGFSLRCNFSTLTNSVKEMSGSVSQISRKMAVFEVHMENTNKHIESIITKMDKVEEHSERLAVIQNQLLKLPEIENRLREVEYAKRATNS